MVENEYKGLIPQMVVLKFISNENNDGLIIKGSVENISYLVSAPNTGYLVREIKVPYKSSEIFFYFKNGQYYGKGFIAASTALPQLGMNRVFLKVMQNNSEDPGEKMNLRSLTY